MWIWLNEQRQIKGVSGNNMEEEEKKVEEKRSEELKLGLCNYELMLMIIGIWQSSVT